MNEVTLSKSLNLLQKIHTIEPHKYPAVHLGDGQHTQSRYKENENGVNLAEWTDYYLYFIIDGKELGLFKSVAWKQEYDPRRCFVSSNEKKTDHYQGQGNFSQTFLTPGTVPYSLKLAQPYQ